MRKSDWNTYAKAQDGAGLHLHQVRKFRTTGWKKRTVTLNGTQFRNAHMTPIDEVEGTQLFQTATDRLQ